MSTASMQGREAPLDFHDEWQRVLDYMSDLDLDADGNPAPAAGLLRKCPDGLAVNWGHTTVLIFECTCAFNSMVNWHILVDQHKQSNILPSGIYSRHVSGQVGLSRSCPSRWASEGHTQSDCGPLPCHALVCKAAKRHRAREREMKVLLSICTE